MNQRSALLIAAALTAFLLVLAGGLASRLSTAPDLGAATAAPTEALSATQVVTLDPTVEALIKDRETAYQQAISEANSRLNQANAQIAQANAQISSLEQSRQQLADQLSQAQAAPVAVAAVAAPASYAISASRAGEIALGVAAPGATLSKAPDLVSYQGTPAYEVTLDIGLVYVDAQTGAVLANDAAAAQLIGQEQAIQVAQSYLGGGTVKDVQLEDEHGAQIYNVRFIDDSRVYVDAASGQVVYAEIRTSGSQYASGGEEHEHEGGGHEGGEHEGGEHDDD